MSKYTTHISHTESIKNDIIDKKDAELALHNSLQYTLRLIEANQ